MSRGLRQLERSAVCLMYLLPVGRFIVCAVRRDTVVQGAAAAGDIHLASDDILPYCREVLHQLFFARLYVEVGCSGIEIVGTDTVSACSILLAERFAVLVVIRTVRL